MIKVCKKILKRIKANRFCRRIKNKKNKKPNILGTVILRQKPDVVVGTNVTFYSNVILWGPGKIIIGDNCAIGDNVIIRSTPDGGITIGDNTLIAANSYLIDEDHSYKKGELVKNQSMNCKPIVVGSDVWIGANTTIVRGVTIGDGAIIGANAFVNKNVESYTVVGGVPAKEIKKRI